ncbi:MULTISPECIES: BlaI/MecI/CopY family transcriptional regulator [unclassified Nocardioides]|uniref:BlaI/MecI/CopY family transcriptional regulator n=1 Tax=unclassified Nocardioides TaxID=2615069 RepID=UPI0009F1249A|nr:MULTISPECIES: BlaI/MecI/CopY family transcriptional regulator [unclassified Nocardioides]GAW49771.1 Transcriptional regulator, BlaI/MecI/CopY family [Nocardioides sp. PD653-B2]GAW56489.1 Transcriptional regulator, BlaI/MecI/CopY family [Nocardioides sp. PD653]
MVEIEEGVEVKGLGELEAAVMQRLWEWDRPVPVRTVLEDLQRERALAYTTVMTVLDNLHTKGFVQRHKDGRAYVYEPAFSREQHASELLGEVLAQSNDRSATLLHFVGQLSLDEAATLRAALNDPSGAAGTESSP